MATPIRDSVKQPRIGDVVAVAVGPVTVTAVHRHGLILDVTDRIGRRFTVERAPRGHWARVSRAQDTEPTH